MKVGDANMYAAITVMLACYVTVLLTFAFALLHGNQVLVTIDSYGEANLEAIILLISIPVVVRYLQGIVQGFYAPGHKDASNKIDIEKQLTLSHTTLIDEPTSRTA